MVEPLLPSNEGRKGRPFTNNRGSSTGSSTGIARDPVAGPLGTVRAVADGVEEALYARRGVWDHVLSHVISQADTRGEVDWAVSIDATINRAFTSTPPTPNAPSRTQGARSNYKQPHWGG